MKIKFIYFVCAIVISVLYGCWGNANRTKKLGGKHDIVHFQNRGNKLNNLDTLISSGKKEDWYMSDKTLFRFFTPEEMKKFSTKNDVAIMSISRICLILQKIGNYTVLLYEIEGEDWYSYIATVKDYKIIDELFAEGLSATPGEEDVYSDLSSFAILKNHSIKIHNKLVRDGVKSETYKIYRINDEGKFYEVKE